MRCDYCHVQAAPDLTRTPSNVGGWVWDRDDKPQKLTARETEQLTVSMSVLGSIVTVALTLWSATTSPRHKQIAARVDARGAGPQTKDALKAFRGLLEKLPAGR